MHKKEAIRVLTKELAKHSGISIVREDWYKEELIKKSKHFDQFNNPVMVNYKHYKKISFENKPKIISSGWYFSNTKHKIKTKEVYATLEGLIAEIESCNGANYFFIDNPLQNKSSKSLNNLHFFVTPYSIIGEDEIINIKKFFYKDVHPQLQSAIDVLSIDNYADVYQSYADNISSGLTGTAVKDFLDSMPNFNYLNDYLSDKKSLNGSESFSDKGSGEKKVTDVESIGDLSVLNSEFEKMGLKSRLDTTKYREEKAIKDYPEWINKMNIEEVVNEIEHKSFLIAQGDTRKERLKQFWDFVFTIPYDDQNIKSNQAILKSHAGEIDYISILGDEYSKDRHFPEYFNCLDDLQQERVARSLKDTPERNIINDSFLWSKGFKEIPRDYMNLYKKDADEFIEYFKSRKQDDKKTILKDIMNCDYTNKTATKWLHENELELVREVSMDG